MFKRIVAVVVAVNFWILGLLPYQNLWANDALFLPPVGQVLGLSVPFTPLIIKGLKVHKDNPFEFDFIINQGQTHLSSEAFRAESMRLVKYFLASLAIPENDLWVNLSPYEKNRITTPELGVTEMGKDLLAQDYVLKQLTASLIYPEGTTGKKFWARVYALAQAKYHTTAVPINTFNKVWIVPQKAVVYENTERQTAYVLESSLKVMLEEDYLSVYKHKSQVLKTDATNSLGSQIVREIVLPELTREVNQGKNFANLRQITSSLILAAWFKRALKASVLGQLYVDQKKINGVDTVDRTTRERIYHQYLRAYTKGVYNYIKEDADPLTGQIIPRKYFSGGVVEKFDVENLQIQHFVSRAQLAKEGEDSNRLATIEFNHADKALLSKEQVAEVFGSLEELVKTHANEFAKSLDLPQNQRDFAEEYGAVIQAWFHNHRQEIQSTLPSLDLPAADRRYQRNHIGANIETTWGTIALYIHVANPNNGVPKHFHGDQSKGGFAWIVPLNHAFQETKWKVQHVANDQYVNLDHPVVYQRSPGVVFSLIDADGAHIMENTSPEEPGYFLELYILPKGSLKGFDIPVSVDAPDANKHRVVTEIDPTLLTYENFEDAALGEGWDDVDQATWRSSLESSSNRIYVFKVIRGETVLIERFDGDFWAHAGRIRQNSKDKRLFVVFNKPLTRLATEDELKDPKRGLITADGIKRTGERFVVSQEDIPQEPVDAVIIGAGASGLATAKQLVDNGGKVVVFEAGLVAQSFSDAFMNFWRMRTPAFRFWLVQKGFNVIKTLSALDFSKKLPEYRRLALRASGFIKNALGKDFTIAQPEGFDNEKNNTVPLARAEAFQHFLEIARSIVENGGWIGEQDPVVSYQEIKEGKYPGLFKVTTQKGVVVIARNVVDARGLGHEKMAESFDDFARKNSDKVTLVNTYADITEQTLGGAKFPVFVSSVLGNWRILEFIKSLPKNAAIGITGGGQSMGNSIAAIHSVRSDIVVHVFSKDSLTKHGSQMPAGFRVAHLMWLYVTKLGLNIVTWAKGGPQAVDTPITPPIFKHIEETAAPNNPTTIVHVLGEYFNPENYRIELSRDNNAHVIKNSDNKEIAVINGGFVSAIGYSLVSDDRDRLNQKAVNNGLVEVDANGVIQIDPANGLTSKLNSHVFIAGIQLFGQGGVPDGSTHGTVVRARAIAEWIINGRLPELSRDQRIAQAKRDFDYLLRFIQEGEHQKTIAALLVLAKSQAGETYGSIINKYRKALESNGPLAAAWYVADVAGQTGRDIEKNHSYTIPSEDRDAIKTRIFNRDNPGLLEQAGQEGRQKITVLFNTLVQTTKNNSAAEQLAIPSTELRDDDSATTQAEVLDVYHALASYEDPLIQGLLTRAALTYLPFGDTIQKDVDAAQLAVGARRVANGDQALLVDRKGGIDLNTSNLEWIIRRDGKGNILPVLASDLARIHLNGLRPVYVKDVAIVHLAEYLGV